MVHSGITNATVSGNILAPFAPKKVFYSLIYTNISRVEDEITNDNSTECDDVINRLDGLDNISPDFYLFDDDEFPRLTQNPIEKENSSISWIRMHDLVTNFKIFSENTSALDVDQGSLGDCYLLSAFASLANRNNGSILKSMFLDLNDNEPNHVYTTRWLTKGKPRFVAVDDWVPGKKGSSFARVQINGALWPLILEKSFAKIYGSYQSIIAGWQSTVWGAITMARTFTLSHTQTNVSALWNLLNDLFKQNYVVGSGTPSSNNFSEISGHGYAVLGVYLVTLDDGDLVKLVRYFNPWHSEVWNTNPWADGSANWTEKVQKQVPYFESNDGIVYSTIEDYFRNFKATTWAEIHDDYDVNYIDLAFRYDDFSNHKFELNFTYYGDPGFDVYIFNDETDSRLLKGCSKPITLSNFVVYTPNLTVIKSTANGTTVKITAAQPGMYKASFSAKKNSGFMKSFTMTAYCQGGKVNFIPPKNNIIIDLQKKSCPNNCNFQGSCNTYDGTCRCYFGYEGTECQNIRNVSCQECPQYAVCDQIFGTCLYPGLFNLGTQSFLNEGSGLYVEMGNHQRTQILQNGLIYNSDNDRYLSVAKSDLNIKKIILQSLSQNSTLPKNLLWNITYLLDKMVITTFLDSELALQPDINNQKLTLTQLDLSSDLQKWILKANVKSCPLDCNGNGVCSQSTGKCICSSGFEGLSCNLTVSANECANNCSQNGFCDIKTGNCNCKQDFIGEACEILYKDFICPQNCSNHGECSLSEAKCICSSVFSGDSCESFSGQVLLDLINMNNGQLLSIDSKEKALLSTNSTIKWNLTSDTTIRASNGKCLQIAFDNLQPNSRVYLSKCKNTFDANNQFWLFESDNNYYFIRSGANQSLALAAFSEPNGTKIIVDNLDYSDSRQKWIFKL